MLLFIHVNYSQNRCCRVLSTLICYLWLDCKKLRLIHQRELHCSYQRCDGGPLSISSCQRGIITEQHNINKEKKIRDTKKSKAGTLRSQDEDRFQTTAVPVMLLERLSCSRRLQIFYFFLLTLHILSIKKQQTSSLMCYQPNIYSEAKHRWNGQKQSNQKRVLWNQSSVLEFEFLGHFI